MQLTIYNSLNNKKELFKPLDENNIKIYVCGPTVYNEIHIGNARSVIVFDILFRTLKFLYPKVTYVRNITDIDDKIMKKSLDEKISIKEVVERWTNSFHDNCSKLNLLSPTFQPKATETINEIIEFIAELIEMDYAYFNEGSVFFKVNMLDEYGQLSKQNEVINAKRIKENFSKTDQRDFVLWKPSMVNEPYWNSPWGKGRPGWHIECSAMSLKFLGKKFDIHGGGQDLLFPHHENENAQNLALNGPFSGPQYWMHNAMLTFDGEKMSKSIGNIILLSEAFELYDPIFLKFYILTTHYRHSLSWSNENIEKAAARFDKWMFHLNEFFDDEAEEKVDKELMNELMNDLNTPGLFALIDENLAQALKNNDLILMKKLANLLKYLGLSIKLDPISKEVENLANERLEAKEQKNYIKADELRKKILEKGCEILDYSKNGISSFKLKRLFYSIK